MFVWAKIPDGWPDSMTFCLSLMERAGVVCTPGGSFGPSGEGYVRFALVLPPEQIREAVEAIRRSGILEEAPCAED
jgi:LL-diaminopimelate aminotransferase